MSIARSVWHRRAEVCWDRAAGELTPGPHGEQAHERLGDAFAAHNLDKSPAQFSFQVADGRRSVDFDPAQGILIGP
jgi:hypothetical protein